MAADFSSLPDHITDTIFVKLSCTKSTVACTSVCKSWYALIKSPRFVNFHLSNAHNDNNIEYFLCRYQRYDQSAPDHCIQFNDNGELRTYYDLEFPHERWIKIIGSINGLICYAGTGTRSDIYIWNPAIGKLKILPKSKFYKKESTYGFWFDANANDYKVAKINYKIRCNVEVYSLSTNSWDLIATGGPNLGRHKEKNVIHVINGTLHLLILRGNSWMIISFDVNNGIYKETVIWQDERFEGAKFDFLVTESHSCSRIVLQHRRYDRRRYFCCLRVYDEGLNQLYMINLKESEKLQYSKLIGVRNINTNEVVFLDSGTDSWTGFKLLVCDVEDFSDTEAFELKDFSSTQYDDIHAISQIRPFAETLVLLND